MEFILIIKWKFYEHLTSLVQERSKNNGEKGEGLWLI